MIYIDFDKLDINNDVVSFECVEEMIEFVIAASEKYPKRFELWNLSTSNLTELYNLKVKGENKRVCVRMSKYSSGYASENFYRAHERNIVPYSELVSSGGHIEESDMNFDALFGC